MFPRYAATSWTTSACARQWLNLAGEPAEKAPSGEVVWKTTMRSGSGYGNGFSSTAFTMEKIAVLAPMPSARAATAASVKPGLFRKERTA